MAPDPFDPAHRRPLERFNLPGLRREIEGYVEAASLDYEAGHRSLRKHQGSYALYSKGTLVATFPNPYAAEFLQRAPDWFRQLMAEIERLRGQAAASRSQRRRLTGVESELREADRDQRRPSQINYARLTAQPLRASCGAFGRSLQGVPGA